MKFYLNRSISVVAAAIVSAIFAGQSFAVGNAEKGKAYYAVCQTCHGPKAEGNQALNSPNLQGLQDWYMIRQIKNFKEGIRGTHPKDMYGAQMKAMTGTLANDQAIEDVVAYIKSLK